ncbi:MAG: hypothetical protein ACXAEB_10785, partial [Candidatus Thorarchaeota archaeon]
PRATWARDLKLPVRRDSPERLLATFPKPLNNTFSTRRRHIIFPSFSYKASARGHQASAM